MFFVYDIINVEKSVIIYIYIYIGLDEIIYCKMSPSLFSFIY